MAMPTSDPFYFPAHEEQRPTHPRIHIQSAEEAHRLFECVRRGLFRPVIRRLNDAERAMYIRSGSVFVWEETEEAIGLRRWTDGLMWSASRMREPFLFYESKSRGRSCTNASMSESSGERSSIDSINDLPTGANSSLSLFLTPHQSRGPRPNYNEVVPGLVKQTYSAIVYPGDGTRRKWHMTAYFTNADFANLPTVADDPVLRHVVVPRGMYKSGKSRQSAKSMQAEWSSPTTMAMNSASNSEPDLNTLERLSADISPQANGTSRNAVWSTGFGEESGWTSSPSESPVNEYPPSRKLYSAYTHSSPSTPSPRSRPGSSQRSTPGGSSGRPSQSPSSYLSGVGPNLPSASESAPSLLPPHSQSAYTIGQGSPVLPPLGQYTYADQRFALPPGGLPMRSGSGHRCPEDQRMLHMFKPIP